MSNTPRPRQAAIVTPTGDVIVVCASLERAREIARRVNTHGGHDRLRAVTIEEVEVERRPGRA